ncbi:MAG: exonuclease domain-containing protein [Clostridia bacterium]
MENITKELQSKFNGKYSFLKLLEVKFDENENLCTVVLMFPETISEIKENEENEIQEFLKSLFDLKSIKLKVAFKKSFLDQSIVASKILSFLKTSFASFATCISENDIKTERFGGFLNVKIALNKQQFSFFNEKNLFVPIIDFLNENFCGEFKIEPKLIKKDEISENISHNRQGVLANEFSSSTNQTKIPRYEVVDPIALIGNNITPKPEFIQNISASKSRVILAGTVENLQEKSFTAKKGKKNSEGQFPQKKYISFTLKDPSSKIRCVYFCPKSNERKLSKIIEGCSILVNANVNVEDGKSSCVVNEISFCTLKKVEKQEANCFCLSSHQYSVAFPKPYISNKQVDIFSRKKIANDYLKNSTFVVFDCETTGLNGDKDEIIEIGAAKIVNGKICETFQTLVCPKNPISKEITEINGINNFMVKNAPKIDDAIKDFALFSAGSVLVAHNLNFDIKFIQNAGRKFGITFDNEKLDTLAFTKSKLTLSNYKLGTIVKELKIELTNAHRALFDAIATAEVLVVLNQQVV